MRRIERSLWVIEHVNNQSFIGRFDGRWTRTYDLDSAALWHSEGEADNARQALLAEALDRVNNSKEQWPSDFWWDIRGGLVVVTEVSQVTTIKERVGSAASDPARPTPGDEGKATGFATEKSPT